MVIIVMDYVPHTKSIETNYKLINLQKQGFTEPNDIPESLAP